MQQVLVAVLMTLIFLLLPYVIDHQTISTENKDILWMYRQCWIHIYGLNIYNTIKYVLLLMDSQYNFIYTKYLILLFMLIIHFFSFLDVFIVFPRKCQVMPSVCVLNFWEDTFSQLDGAINNVSIYSIYKQTKFQLD